MGDSLPLNPNPNPPPPNPNPNPNPPPPPPPSSLHSPPAPSPPAPRFLLRRPPIRATTEFDSSASDNPLFHKISCKLLDGLAKLKLCCRSNNKGQISSPELALVTDRFKLFYDVESKNALLQGCVDIGRFFRLQATHDVKCGRVGVPDNVHLSCSTECVSFSCNYRNQNSVLTSVKFGTLFLFKYFFTKHRDGDIALIANLGDPSYKLELQSSVPSVGLPRATLIFPNGEVSVQEVVKEEEESQQKVLSVNGIVRSNIFDGIGTAMFTNDDLNLRYCYKDKELTFVPSITLPSNAVSFAFKRRFSPSDKLSYLYQFDTNDWSAVYKHTARKDLKFKAGYDSSVDGGLKWACVWVGDEKGGVKSVPFKMRFKLMLQVPQDVNRSEFLFHVKKRWDF